MSHSPELLIAYDDSEAAQAALRWAIQYAQEGSRRVLMLYVMSSLEEWELAAIQVNPDPIRRRFHDLLTTKWSEPLRVAGIPYRTTLAIGRPAEAILSTARGEHVELIALGMTERGLLHEIVQGTTVRHVLHDARRPVVAVPPDWRPTTSGTDE